MSERHVSGLPPVVGPDRLVALVRGLGFWTAVVLPFCYLPLLGVSDFVSAPTWLFVGAVLLNVLALLVGHGHEPRRYSQG